MPATGRVPTTVDEPTLEGFRDSLRGDLLLPGDPGYDEARALWNGMVDSHPAFVVRAAGPADVMAAVGFAREQGLELAVHGGGHNVAGYATTDGGLMLDLSPMDGVRVDRARRTVRVEGGATLGDVDRETQLFGLAAPLGVVSATGVAGLTLNGGYGHLSREFGLAADNLRSVDIVTADGELRTASADSHPDLFWAVRGGGGNFGVVTSLEYDCHEVGPAVYALFVWYHGDETRTVLDRFREWAAVAPRDAGVLPFVAHVPETAEFPESAWGEPAVVLLGSARGDSAGPDIFGPLTGELTPLADHSGPMAFEDLQRMLDEDYPDGLRYYWKSTYLTEVTDGVVDLLIRANDAAPSALSTVDIWHLGGAVADVSQDATAFWHRDKPFMLTFEANWEDPGDDDTNVTWARDWFAELASMDVASGRYGNFPGGGEDPASLLFGGNYDRLVEVKTRYDPENLFHRNQNVPPRAAD